MEASIEKILDSPSKNSYIGSYYPPPDRILQISKQLDFSAHSCSSREPQVTCVPETQTKPSIDSKAVIDALKTLQEKIRGLELERKEAERSYRQFTHDIQKQQQVKASNLQSKEAAETEKSKKKELECAEARCKSLEKQLDYMRRMVEKAQTQRDALGKDNKQESQQQNEQQSSSTAQIQQQKLETLEVEYLKLSRTINVAEMKIVVLEQRLQKEEEERKRAEEKADELRKELEHNLHLAVPANEESEPKKKKKKPIKKTPNRKELLSPSSAMCRKMPFVAGKSVSPSHSVHANVQEVLHMMKHHQPHLCERLSALYGCSRGRAKKNLQTEFSSSTGASRRSHDPSDQTDRSLSSLSDLLLDLQDELGHMSFEHQDLMRAIDDAQCQEEKQELQAELERLVVRMEEKGVQITKLRKHQQAVKMLAQPRSEKHAAKKTEDKPKQKKKDAAAANDNLQVLRETKKFRSCLKEDDLYWES